MLHAIYFPLLFAFAVNGFYGFFFHVILLDCVYFSQTVLLEIDY